MSVPDFMELFDAYANARAELRRTDDDDQPAIRIATAHCASLWQRLLDARNQFMEAA